MRGRFGFSAVRGTQRKLPVGIPAGGVTQPAPGLPTSIDATLPTPLAVLDVAQTAYPVQFGLVNLVANKEGDELWIMRTDDDAGTVNKVFYRHTITIGDINSADPRQIVFTSLDGSSHLSDIAAGTYRYRFYTVRAGNRSPDPAGFVTHGPDDVAPVLTAAVAPANVSAGGATLTVTTDTPEGTLYLVVCAANVRPTDAQITTGKDSTGAAAVYATSQAVASIGVKTANAVGGAGSTTYYPFWIHKDAAGNPGHFDGQSFTTGASTAFGMAETYHSPIADYGFAPIPAGTYGGVSFGAATASRAIIVDVDYYDGGNLPSGVTVGGIAATMLASAGNQSTWIAAVPTGASGEIVVGGNPAFCGIKVTRMVGANLAPTQIATLPYNFNGSPQGVAVTTPAGGATRITASLDTTVGAAAWSNAVGDTQDSQAHLSFCSATRLTAGAATVGISGFGNQNSSMIAVSFAP